jgi:DNA polymerase alpha subunit B
MNIEHQIMRNLSKNKQKAIVTKINMEKASYFYVDAHQKPDYVAHRLNSMRQSFLDLLEIPEFSPVNFQSPQSFFTFGMITTLTGEKIENEVYLQNTTDKSNIPIRLNLKGLEGYSLFKGQLVAVRGKNIKGNEIHVENIYYLPIIDINTSKKDHLSCVISKGPFSKEMLDKLVGLNPEVLILLGPFCGPGLCPTFSTLEADLKECLKQNMCTKVVIVPCLQDYNAIKVLPQLALKCSLDRVIAVPNPSHFYINNHYISVANFDSLHELSAEEYFKEYKSEEDIIFSGDRVSRLSHHLLFQKTFLPVFPSSFNVSYGKCLDMNVCPDILLISSKMIQFSRVIGPSTILNCGVSNGKYIKIASLGKESKYAIDFVDL